MSDRLSSTLQKLISDKKFPPTGDKGFEGLIAKLLEVLTGRHFHLAKSGYQEGRDMSCRDSSQNVIAIECKRYGKTTKLDERELLGELDQVKVGIPDLDIWVLITSRDVDSKLYESLHRNASQHGIGFAVIASGDGEPSSLAVLCANSPATVTKFLKPVALDEDLQKLEDELDKIANHSQLSQKVNRLREKFLSPLVGYENWRVEQNQKLLDYFKSEKDSRAVFGQPIDVEGNNVRFIERTELTKQLDNWYSTWGKKRNVFAILGEQGDGKTWGVAHWLNQKIQKDDKFSGVTFLSSRLASINEPYALFSEAIGNFLHLDSNQCEKRIRRWIEKQVSSEPILLVVLDGINEHYNFQWWRELIEKLDASSWQGKVAVLITCRDIYWKRNFSSLCNLETSTYKLPCYNKDELTKALKANGIDRSQLSNKLFESDLIYKPRYFNLVIQYQEIIGDVGNITVPRLIYEDWKNRYKQKRVTPITDDDFQQVIKDLSAKVIGKSKKKLKDREIKEILPFVSDQSHTFEELRTGDILIEKRGGYEINEKFLTYGFGLLLLENLADAAETGEVNLEEVIAKWLEPHAEMDIKGEICHFASLISLGDAEIPLEVKVTLLSAWVNSQNPGKDIDSEFIEYLPVDPEVYIDLAEIVWSYKTENPWAQELLMRAFIRWRENDRVMKKLSLKLEEWLGFVHLYGFPHSRRANRSDCEIEQILADICRCVGQQLKSGQVFTFNGYQLTAINDDGLLRLGRVALRIIDYLPVKPFIRAIATGAMAEAIMVCSLDYRYQDKYDLFQWIFASADDNLYSEVKSEVENLKGANNLLANRVAYFLLSWEGSQKAFQLRETLPQDLFLKDPWIERHKQDICNSWYRWGESDCITCLKRADLTLHWVAQKIVPHCLNPSLEVPDNLRDYFAPLTEKISIDSIWSEYWQNSDDIHFKLYEPALCAYAPDAIADLVRQIVRGIINRSGTSLRQLCFKLEKLDLIFEETQKQSIYKVWQQFGKKCDITGDLEQVAEARLFKVVLEQLEPEKQLDYFLQRPETSSDWVSLERSFKPLQNSESVLSKLPRLNNDTSIQRTLWFLSAYQENLTAEQISQHIYPFLEVENSLTKSLVLKILYRSQDEKIIQHFIDSSWQWDVQHHDLENHWGNLLLCQYGQNLSFSALKDRVHPSFLGIAIRDRNMKPEEVEQYADYIDLLWNEIKENVPELPLDFPLTEIRVERDENFTDLEMIYLSDKYINFSQTYVSKDSTWGGIGSSKKYGSLQDFDERDETRKKLNKIGEDTRKEQSEANNCFFNYKIPRDILSSAIAQRPNLVDKWLEPIQGEQSETVRKVIRVGTLFYETLCYVLLERSHPRAIELYRYLSQNESQIILKDARTNTRYLDYALFQASPTESLEQEWLHRLENCYSDSQLMEVAIVAQLGQRESWLLSRIERQLQSSAPGDFSQAVTMLAFLETDDAIKQLKNLATSQPDTWRKRLVDISMERWQRNSWAKHWFREFLNQEDRVMSWRGFRLFLQCADKRFWLWKKQSIAEAAAQSFHPYYLNFLEDNADTVNNAIRNSKYNQELDKTFLAHKTT